MLKTYRVTLLGTKHPLETLYYGERDDIAAYITLLYPSECPDTSYVRLEEYGGPTIVNVTGRTVQRLQRLREQQATVNAELFRAGAET